MVNTYNKLYRLQIASTQFLNIGVEGQHTELTATLYDIHGKLNMQDELQGGQQQLQLDIGQLAMANYVLRIKNLRGNYSSVQKSVRAPIDVKPGINRSAICFFGSTKRPDTS